MSDRVAGLPSKRNTRTDIEDKDCIPDVDDEPEIRRLLVNYLERNGFAVVAARDGREMWHMLQQHAVDSLLLDLMLPDTDGPTLCRDLRAKSNLQVLMLTALGEDADRFMGIEMGADGYLVKPFNPRQLQARIQSILRRTHALPPNLKPEPVHCLAFADWCLDTAERLLTSPDGVATPLSGGEFRLLRLLLEHPNRFVTRDQLIEMIHGREPGAGAAGGHQRVAGKPGGRRAGTGAGRQHRRPCKPFLASALDESASGAKKFDRQRIQMRRRCHAGSAAVKRIFAHRRARPWPGRSHI
ncbi:response regulator [Rhodoferax sp.]|uniref:response regulator transcription factor n=1 Tax=Rhodoferax sp. TaxID=50421 RepID=UPI0025FF3501|nr:response regulator [Rhodoferax sp.]